MNDHHIDALALKADVVQHAVKTHGWCYLYAISTYDVRVGRNLHKISRVWEASEGVIHFGSTVRAHVVIKETLSAIEEFLASVDYPFKNFLEYVTYMRTPWLAVTIEMLKFGDTTTSFNELCGAFKNSVRARNNLPPTKDTSITYRIVGGVVRDIF
jgi:hypothetical protein